MADQVLLGLNDPELALRVLSYEKLRRSEFFWKKADGTTVNVKDMDDHHLDNTIRMLRLHIENKNLAMESAWDAEGRNV